jgi:hypothetical protein
MKVALVLAVGLSAFGVGAAGCFGNPVHDELVASLGGEAEGVPPGPLHRPGQPCFACHSSDGPAELQLAVGGTVFQDMVNVFPNSIAAAGVTVTFTDANDVVSEVLSNCAGNFYVTHDDWVAAGYAFPIHMQISWQMDSFQMVSHIGKEGSCATCHVWAVPAMNGMPAMAPAPGPDHVGQIYLSSTPITGTTPSCPMGTSQ